jgi:hypothetical protein
MNRAIDSAAAEKRRVRGVHDCIDIQLGDVTPDNVDPGFGIFHLTARAVR